MLIPFFGQRHLAPATVAPALAAILPALAAAGCSAACGGVGGVAVALSRQSAALGVPLVVTSPASFAPAALVARSVALVREAASFPGLTPVSVPARAFAFVAGPCPAGIVPAQRWCSGRTPSGTWSEVALSLGLGLSVCLLWAAPGPVSLPAWALSALVTLPLPAFVLSPAATLF